MPRRTEIHPGEWFLVTYPGWKDGSSNEVDFNLVLHLALRPDPRGDLWPLAHYYFAVGCASCQTQITEHVTQLPALHMLLKRHANECDRSAVPE